MLALRIWGQHSNLKNEVDWVMVGDKNNDLSNIAYDNQDFDSCLIYTKVAFEAYTRAENWEKASDQLLGMAGVYYGLSEYEQSTFYNIKAEAFIKQHLQPRHLNLAYVLNIRALINDIKGRYEDAIEEMTQASEIFALNNASNIDLAIHLQNLAQIQRKYGDYDKAINNLEQALRYRQAAKKKQELGIAKIYTHLAYNYRWKKAFTNAINFNKKAIDILRQLPRKGSVLEFLLDSYISLAEVYRLQNMPDSAWFFIGKALDLQRGELIYAKEKSYNELGQLALEKDNPDKALTYFKKALELTKVKYQQYQHHPKLGLCWGKIADTYMAKNQYEQALDAYQQALQLLSVGFTNQDINANPPLEKILSLKEGFPVFQGKARALVRYFEKNQDLEFLKIALDTYIDLIALINEMRLQYESEESKLFLLANVQEVFEEGIKVALQIYDQTRDYKYLMNAIHFSEQNKSIQMQEALTENIALGIAGIPDSLLQKEENLRKDIAFYKRQLLEAENRGNAEFNEQIIVWREQLFKLNQTYQKLQNKLEANYKHYFQLKRNYISLDIETLQDSYLMADQGLISYFVGKDNIYLFGISRQQLEVVLIPSPNEIMHQVMELTMMIKQPPLSEDYLVKAQRFNFLAYRLYQALLQPILLRINNPSTLIIIPDAQLNYLPFEILLTTNGGRDTDFRIDAKDYLLEDYSISYSYSISLLRENEKKENSLTSFAGFAPSFDKRTSTTRSCQVNQLYSLQCNQEEVESIHQLLGGNAFLGEEASKEHFQYQVENAGILHLATHACINLEEGALNQIFFTDDYLTSIELKALEVSASLAVLSACNTGAGKMQIGEGLMSLSRSFTIAGCPSTLMSLWSVDDCATSDIMIEFYKQLKKGKNKSEAIRGAKLNYLDWSSKAKAHPYYWAGFLLVGDNKALFANTSTRFFYWLIPGIIMLLLIWYFYFLKPSSKLDQQA